MDPIHLKVQNTLIQLFMEFDYLRICFDSLLIILLSADIPPALTRRQVSNLFIHIEWYI